MVSRARYIFLVGNEMRHSVLRCEVCHEMVWFTSEGKSGATAKESGSLAVEKRSLSNWPVSPGLG